jgi:release factor glutamine methyltransferase
LISNPETIQEILVNATRALGATMPCREGRFQAEILLAHTLGLSRAGLLARLSDSVDPKVAAQFAARVARRAEHEPLAYILGHQEFYGLDFLVDRRVLIPRHETEMLVLLALQHMQRALHAAVVVVDVGTGSGALALALARHLPSARILATDISSDALSIAHMNAARLNLKGRVKLLQGDLLTPVTDPFDVLVANLPYVPSRRYMQLPREIREFEPRLALDGGDDGFAVMRRLLAQLEAHAARGAVAFFEISEEQGLSAVALFKQQFPRAMLMVHRDLEGLDRVIEIGFQEEARTIGPALADRDGIPFGCG